MFCFRGGIPPNEKRLNTPINVAPQQTRYVKFLECLAFLASFAMRYALCGFSPMSYIAFSLFRQALCSALFGGHKRSDPQTYRRAALRTLRYAVFPLCAMSHIAFSLVDNSNLKSQPFCAKVFLGKDYE